jgi:hypothetical protein
MAMLHKKLIGVFGAVALATMLVAGPASAAPGDLVVSAGSLDWDGGAGPTISAFNPITLTGVPQLTTLTVDPFTVVDATGSAAGWNVLLTIPNLVEPVSSDTILASQISMTAPTVAPVGTSDMTGVAAHASAGGFNAGEKIVTASAGNGQGMYLVSPFPAKLVVPVDARVGTYASAATIAIVSGP